MHIFIQNAVDIIFPPSKDTLMVRNISNADICDFYKPNKNSDITTLSIFSDTEISALIHEAKFHNNNHAMELLGGLLAIHFTNMIDYSLKHGNTSCNLTILDELSSLILE